MTGISALYAAEVFVVINAAIGMVYLRRASDREWRRHKLALQLVQFGRALVKIQITMRDQLTPAVANALKQIRRMAAATSRADS